MSKSKAGGDIGSKNSISNNKATTTAAAAEKTAGRRRVIPAC